LHMIFILKCVICVCSSRQRITTLCCLGGGHRFLSVQSNFQHTASSFFKASSSLVCNINHGCPWDMLARASIVEKGVEGVISTLWIHLSEYHAPGSTVPSNHYQSGLQPTMVAHGTCLPEPGSLKKVLKESPPPCLRASVKRISCSRLYSSQQPLLIWTPALNPVEHESTNSNQARAISAGECDNTSWLEINKDGPGDVLASASLADEGVE